ncbi:hypothetical protein GT755_12510 [Herbidospora sp. NEAU-GS84]|uniref:Uncharacterized protein n=1 Tax=Herbidospora solisilvae TaxID=2696284 RepID=A0A7C9J2K1_9ACTN|nr:hypothetical protein [Herbidospora solisilvae]NAS22505.1 hypothetical protein [Herbidospora solisilvae]
MPFFPHYTLWRLLALHHAPAWWEFWTALICVTWACAFYGAHPLLGIPVTLAGLIVYLAGRGLYDWHDEWIVCDCSDEEDI